MGSGIHHQLSPTKCHCPNCQSNVNENNRDLIRRKSDFSWLFRVRFLGYRCITVSRNRNNTMAARGMEICIRAKCVSSVLIFRLVLQRNQKKGT